MCSRNATDGFNKSRNLPLQLLQQQTGASARRGSLSYLIMIRLLRLDRRVVYPHNRIGAIAKQQEKRMILGRSEAYSGYSHEIVVCTRSALAACIMTFTPGQQISSRQSHLREFEISASKLITSCQSTRFDCSKKPCESSKLVGSKSRHASERDEISRRWPRLVE